MPVGPAVKLLSGERKGSGSGCRRRRSTRLPRGAANKHGGVVFVNVIEIIIYRIIRRSKPRPKGLFGKPVGAAERLLGSTLPPHPEVAAGAALEGRITVVRASRLAFRPAPQHEEGRCSCFQKVSLASGRADACNALPIDEAIRRTNGISATCDGGRSKVHGGFRMSAAWDKSMVGGTGPIMTGLFSGADCEILSKNLIILYV